VIASAGTAEASPMDRHTEDQSRFHRASMSRLREVGQRHDEGRTGGGIWYAGPRLRDERPSSTPR
jgi:hypothetical protein